MSLTWHTPILQGNFPKDFYLSVKLYHVFGILVNMDAPNKVTKIRCNFFENRAANLNHYTEKFAL